MNPTPSKPVRFRAFPQFNDPDLQRHARLKHRVGELARPVFDRPRLYDRLARALCDRRAVSVKELLESAEFHTRTRKRMRGRVMVDLCCGHGLTGALFALERQVERVLLLDRRRPDSFATIVDALQEVQPDAAAKLTWIDADVEDAARHVPEGAGVIGVHACGPMTDRVLDAALERSARAIAVMPCCYGQACPDTPPALRSSLGAEIAVDVHRSYRLEAAGYAVHWARIPAAITPMHRVVLGVRDSARRRDADGAPVQGGT